MTNAGNPSEACGYCTLVFHFEQDQTGPERIEKGKMKISSKQSKTFKDLMVSV